MSYLLILLGGVLVLIFLGVMASMRSTQRNRPVHTLDSVRNENRARLSPIKRLHDELEELIERNQDKTVVKVIGAEAMPEARRILDHAIRMLNLRDGVMKAAQGGHAVAAEISALQAKIQQAANADERKTLEVALQARTLESTHYAEANQTLETIDAGLRQAEAALSEMKARLNLAAAQHSLAGETPSELTETVSRLRALTQSFDEAEDLVRGRIQ